jgi:hypothetical protein
MSTLCVDVGLVDNQQLYNILVALKGGSLEVSALVSTLRVDLGPVVEQQLYNILVAFS